MRARNAVTAACASAALLAHRTGAVVIDAATSTSFTIVFGGGHSQRATLSFDLSFGAAVEDAATPVLCGVAQAAAGLSGPATLTLTDLPESASLALTYALNDGSDSRSGSAWVALPNEDAFASDICWTCVFASLSSYSIAWSQELRRGGTLAPVPRSDGSCSCWLCDEAPGQGSAGGVCRSAPQDACASPVPDQLGPPPAADDSLVAVPSTAPPPLLSPPEPPSSPQPPMPPPPPWFLEYWPQLAVPPPARPPPPAVSGLAGPQAPLPLPPPWWLGSRGTGYPPPPPQLQSNITTGDLPWWALLQEDAASPPPPSPSAADVVAQMLNGSPPGPPGDTTQLQQALESWLSAVPALAAPAGGGTSPASVIASVLADVVARKEATRPSAAAATVLGLGAAAASSVWGLWTSPVVGPYVLELWAQAESAVWPGAQGAG